MKQTILKIDEKIYSKQLNTRKAICITVAIVTVLLNVLFCFLRNDDNHKLMLALNIVIDILVAWFVYAFLSFAVLPQSRLLKLYKSKRLLCRGVVTEISQEIQRVQQFDCYQVVIGVENPRVFFLPNNCIVLEVGKECQFATASNIIVEVEYE